MDSDEIIQAVLESGRVRRAEAVKEALAPLTPRERSLVRDAAVMGFVHGTMHPAGAPIPKDTDIFHGSVYSITTQPDKDYPVIKGHVHQYSDIGGTVPVLDHPVVRPIWNWILAANDGYGTDVDDLIMILNALGVPCPDDLKEN